MRREHVRDLLQQVANGSLDVGHALDSLAFEPAEPLAFATIDHHRTLRQGFPEVIYGAGKTPDQICEIHCLVLVSYMAVPHDAKSYQNWLRILKK